MSIKNLSGIVFIVLFLFNSYNLYSQATLPVSRTAWGGAEPIGWTNSGCALRNTTFACTGSDATTFDNNGDSRMVFFSSAPDQLIFKLKRASMSGASSLLVQESTDGSTWTNIGNYGTAAGATSITDCGNITITLNCLSRYIKWTYTKDNGNCDMDDVTITSFTGTCGGCVAPTISLQPSSVSTNTSGTASYTITASGTSLTFQWQQNSGSGFVNISNGGTNPTYAGATSSVLTISNPPLSMSGYSYQCIVSNACGTVTTNGTATITVTNSLTCPYLISAVINSCNGCASEGNNEFIVINSGSYSFVVNPTNVKVTYSSGPTNITSGFAAQPASLATLNTATMNSCGTTFVDVSAGTTSIPPNSIRLIINKGACFTGDWSSYCGLGNVYVAFSSASAWTTTGFFGNNTTPRSFDSDFSAINSSCGVTNYAYNQIGVAGTPFDFGTSDGASVSFNGTTPSYITGNGTCAPSVAILPITLLDFSANKINEGNQITWKIADEINIQKYIIEKSSDGVNFELLNTISPNEKNNYEIKIYQVIDYQPNSGINYYRLSTLEKDGLIYPIKTISISQKYNQLETLIYQNDEKIYIDFKNILDNIINIQLIDLTGKLLIEKNAEQSLEEIKVSEFSKGIYFIRIISAEKMINHKIIIQE
jgi:hypothetical protein